MGVQLGYEVGDGTAVAKSSPVQVTTGTVFVDVVCGVWFTLALDESGYVWGWGMNHYGNLGATNNGGNITTPTKLDAVNTFTGIAAGENTSLFLKSDGTLWGLGEKRPDGER